MTMAIIDALTEDFGTNECSPTSRHVNDRSASKVKHTPLHKHKQASNGKTF
jgi:hypothetical protein